MIVVDTDVVSELMRGDPNAQILAWLDSRPTRGPFVTAVIEAEVRTGVAILPEDAHRRSLAEAAERTFGGLFAGRVLPFDSDAARACAEIVATRRSAGRPVSQADGQITATARARGMAVATRNVRDFEDIDIEVVDPWAA